MDDRMEDRPATDGNLQAFAAQLAPSAAFQKEAGEVTDSVAETLRRSGREGRLPPVDRVVVSGSFGRKTAVSEPDIDIVFFLNGWIPSPTENERVLRLAEEAIRARFSCLDHSTLVRINSRSSMHTSLTVCGVNVDVLPAPNLVRPGSSSSGVSEKQSLQFDAVLELLGRSSHLERDKELLSPALAETQLQFVKEVGLGSDTPGFVNLLVRLVKYWKQCVLPGHYSSMSYMLELVACKAAQDEVARSGGSPNIVRALESFMSMLENYNYLNVVFTTFYTLPLGGGGGGSSRIPTAAPLVLDPANPYNNVASSAVNRSGRSFNELSVHAASCLSRLKRIQNGMTVSIKQLFQPDRL